MKDKKPKIKNVRDLCANVLKGLIITAVVSALVENQTKFFSEILFPRTILEVNEGYLSELPQVQIIGDSPNHSTAALFDESADVMFTLLNDNNSSILINSIDLVVLNYSPLPESDYLLLRGHYAAGEVDEIKLGTTQPINSKKKKYSLKVLDSDTGLIDFSKHLQIESSWTDIYKFNLKIEDEGLYDLMFVANYSIHGMKKTAESNSFKLLYKPLSIKKYVNNKSDNLEDYLVAYNEDSAGGDYFLYGNGDFFVDKDGIYTDRFDLYFYLIKRIHIEDGTTTLSAEHVPDCYYIKGSIPDLEIHLPTSIRRIEDNTFPAFSEENDINPDDITYCTIVYAGTEDEWNSIEIEDNNEGLDKCTMQFLSD